jgi:plastocyanin
MRVPKTILAVVVAPLVACGGGGDGGTTPPVTDVVSTVTLSQSSPTMRPADVITISATARNASGATLTGKTVVWAVTQTGTIINIVPSGASVQITAVAVGTAQVQATVEGKTAQAQIVVTNQPFPNSADVAVSNNQFTPEAANIAAGGSVTWTWAQGSVDHNVTFAASGNPAAVNNIAQRSTGSDARTFAVAGTYSYQCTIHGSSMSGTVVVH